MHPEGVYLGWGEFTSKGVCIQADPPPSDTKGYGQRAEGAHPTGMHSCSRL